jgi:hypothetical protein
LSVTRLERRKKEVYEENPKEQGQREVCLTPMTRAKTASLEVLGKEKMKKIRSTGSRNVTLDSQPGRVC